MSQNGRREVSKSVSRSSTASSSFTPSVSKVGRHGSVSSTKPSRHVYDDGEEDAIAESWLASTTVSRTTVLQATWLPLASCVLSFAALCIMAGLLWKSLPKSLISEFGTSVGTDTYLIIILVGTGVLNLVNILSTYLFQAVLCWRCVENQEYWVAVPERERDTVVFLTRLTLWCNVVINVYIICSVAIVLAANRRTDARPTTVDTVLQAVFLITAVAFFVLLFHQLKQRFTKHAYSAVRTNRV